MYCGLAVSAREKTSTKKLSSYLTLFFKKIVKCLKRNLKNEMKVFIIGKLFISDESNIEIEAAEFRNACEKIGANLAQAGHEILVCSPFEDSADYHVLKGASQASKSLHSRIAFHYIDTEEVRNKLDSVVTELGLERVSKIPSAPLSNEGDQARRYAWLLCQLNALESSHATIALGGDLDGAANMLLLLAAGKSKAVLPLPFLGGAAKLDFSRRRFELKDRLGQSFETLNDQRSASTVSQLLDAISRGSTSSGKRLDTNSFFISYSRDRSSDADFTEALLRRRNLRVSRDESDFGAGYAIPASIRESIFGATVFVALWCAEYACSPWCFDEMELALDRRDKGAIELWILCLDKTRVVPKRARCLLFLDASTRSELESSVIAQLERLVRNS